MRLPSKRFRPAAQDSEPRIVGRVLFEDQYESVTTMTGFIHILSSVVFVACALSLAVGAVVFLRNILRKDPEYELRFPWWVRLLLYFVAFAIPPIGLLGGLWLGAFRKSRERLKFAKGFLLVSLIPLLLYVGMYVDPTSRVTDCANSIFHPTTSQSK